VARRPAAKRAPVRPAPVEEPKHRSHSAAPVAVGLLFVGLLLGTVTIVLPVVLGTFLLLTGLSFLSTRLNPLSLGFYLRTKPSWSAIGVIFLSALLLFLTAWAYYVHGIGPLVPGHA
jgi:hypothetical protein